MKGFDVLKVKSAVKTHNKFNLSRTHLTTMDFGEIVPMFVEETVPGDKFNISAEYFSRMAPLVVPTYGKFSYKTVAAFVPYHQIAYDSDAWIAGKTAWEGVTPVQRYLTVESLYGFVAQYCCESNSGVTSANTDYTIIDPSGNTKYMKFTAAGKYYVKVLNALGYALPEGVDYRSTSVWYTNVKDTKLSAYPLLAFFKLYNDYMSQSQRFNSSELTDLLRCVKYNVENYDINYYGDGWLSSDCIHGLFSHLFLNYENDYFVSAWQQPNNALAGAGESTTQVVVPNIPNSYDEGVIGRSGSDNFLIGQVDDNEISVGQRALDFLKSFDDWVRRNNYSGSRAVQQIYSRFGIKTEDYKSHYAQVITTDTMPIQVGDITSTADAGNAVLGDYAGKGIMNGGNNVSVQVSDFGVILILGYFTVAPMNAFGSDRRVLRTTPLDYYNPEFDGLGADAISVGELWQSPIGASSSAVTDNSVFGFTERYNAYRYGRDVITGEFRNYL